MSSVLSERLRTVAHADLSRIGAIVLAAGYSSRMGRFKPLLPLNGGVAIESTLRSLRHAGIHEIVVVLGHRAEEVRHIAEAAGARCIVNASYRDGMFTSVQTGIRAVTGNVDGCFVLPADIPLIRPATLRLLAGTFVEQHKAVVYPVFAARRGHPPLIAQRVLLEGARDGESGPLSELLARQELDAFDIEVADAAIHMDMDTPDDYSAIIRMAARRDIPTDAECAVISSSFGSPRAARHGLVVAEIATFLTMALQTKGLGLNLDLVCAGAQLHDIAKGQPQHAEAGAEILRTLGFPRVAAVVAAHTEPEAEYPPFDESAIVFLADKLVSGESYVGLEKRFGQTMARFENDPEALAVAQRRLAKAKSVQARIDATLSASIDAVVSAYPKMT